MKVVCERHRTFQRQLRSRADGEMSGRRRVAQQNDIAVGPALAQDAREVQPSRTAKMSCVRHQLAPAKFFREDLFADGVGFHLTHAAKAVSRPGLLAAFDDEGRSVGVELISVRPYPAELRLLETEREGVI